MTFTPWNYYVIILGKKEAYFCSQIIHELFITINFE